MRQPRWSGCAQLRAMRVGAWGGPETDRSRHPRKDRARSAASDRFTGDDNGERADLIQMHGRSEEQRDDLVEQAAREIQLRGLTVPAVLFLQASRPYRPLGSSAMVFFDPTLRRVFGGELPVATEILADDLGIEQLIERLQDPDEEICWDA